MDTRTRIRDLMIELMRYDIPLMVLRDAIDSVRRDEVEYKPGSPTGEAAEYFVQRLLGEGRWRTEPSRSTR